MNYYFGWYQRELQAKLDAELKFDKERIQELTALLSLSSQKLKDDRLMYDKQVVQVTNLMSENQMAMELQRKEHEKLLNNAINARDDALEQVNNLMLINKQNEHLITTYGREEMERRKQLLSEIKMLKDTIHDNANHFVVSLNAIQQVVRKMCSEMMSERNRLRNLSAQHMKLGNILSEITGRQSNLSESLKRHNSASLDDSVVADKESVAGTPVPDHLVCIPIYTVFISQIIHLFHRKN